MLRASNGRCERLGRGETSLVQVARGLMTTDTYHKVATRELVINDQPIRVTGMAKGAAMIGPNLATMLAVVLTDAALDPEDAQQLLRDAVNSSFNCISVEGHTSTNDTVLLLASGAGGSKPLAGQDLRTFSQAVEEVCVQLAREIPKDGEGATHLIEIEVQGCRNRDDAHRLAQAIADSPLVKTAVAGADPNWGRIVSAAGYSGVEFDPDEVELVLNDTLLFRHGTPMEFDAEQVASSIRENRDTRIQLRLKQGTASIRFWTCDLTTEYVRLNADYHT